MQADSVDRSERRDAPAHRVLIVDDHTSFSELLAKALNTEPDFACVGTVANGDEAAALARREAPDIVIMDIQLGAESGLDVAARIRADLPDVVVVIVSALAGPAWLAKASRVGASAFVPKSGSLSEMLGVLRTAKTGSMLVAPSLFQEVNRSRIVQPETAERLTPREYEVLVLMGNGVAPREIAHALNISLTTCRGYVKSVHSKLGVRSQLEAVVKAQRLGLINANDDG